MTNSLRIAMFVGCFPVVSETFIVRQIAGLLECGHEVDLFSDTKPDAGSQVHPEVIHRHLLERTHYMNMAPETAPWEMPVWPVTGRTWPPGSSSSVSNAIRLGRALPKLLRCLVRAPRLTLDTLRPSKYGYQASSLSALHRLAALTGVAAQYDVLHAHFGPVGNSFRFARALWQAPLLVSFHGHDFSSLPRKQGLGMYEKLFAVADAVTVNSEYTRRQVENLGCASAKLRLLPVGLDPAEFPFRARSRQPGSPVRILTVGRLVEIKGHEHLIRAVATAAKRHPDIHCDIVGDGPLRKQLTGLLEQLGLQRIVTLHGARPNGEVARLMTDADLFVLSSVSVDGDQEGQGLVLQEAQASGLPVIATNHGALPEGLLPGRSGFLVPERDAEALAERLIFLLEHPETWAEMGRQGREFVATHYDIARLTAQLVGLYTNVITTNLGPKPGHTNSQR